MLDRIDHIGVAVEDLEEAVALYRDRLGMELVHRELIDSQGVEAVLLDVGDSHIELLRPLGSDTPVGKFMARSGAGMHHVAYRVGNVERALEQAKQIGMSAIDKEPRTGIRDSRVAFLHPNSTGGVLTELVQPAEEHA